MGVRVVSSVLEFSKITHRVESDPFFLPPWVDILCPHEQLDVSIRTG
jgi:hypothetical protein